MGNRRIVEGREGSEAKAATGLALQEALESMFLICSQLAMPRIDEQYIAERILAAPGWARLGITERRPELRAAAANELARAILAQAAAPSAVPAIVSPSQEAKGFDSHPGLPFHKARS